MNTKTITTGITKKIYDMSYFKNHLLAILSGVCILSVASCSSTDEPMLVNENGQDVKNSCRLVFNVSKTEFDDEQNTRSASEWADGDKIYLTFTVDSLISYGDAVYDNGEWNVNYYGNLEVGKSAKCSAVYFDNPEFESNTVVTLSANTGIYEDNNGSYVYNDSTLSVTADLKPKTGRIRFSGEDKEKITVYGISHYTTFDYSTGKFTKTERAITDSVATDYTPYIYGYFTDANQPRLNVLTETSAFTKLPSNTIYQAGQSGYMSIPTVEAHSGWQNSAIFKLNGVEFTMIPVEYASGNYLLAETETTRELYEAIIQGNSYTSDFHKPAFVTYSGWETFINKINSITGLTFRFPAESKWKFAAQGGNLSKGYTYSGSDEISDVAWYNANSNTGSGNESHDVKQLQPNELGFYDMSGNAAEWVISSGSYKYYYGGNYNSGQSDCKVTSYNSTGSSSDKNGLRLALNL